MKKKKRKSGYEKEGTEWRKQEEVKKKWKRGGEKDGEKERGERRKTKRNEGENMRLMWPV